MMCCCNPHLGLIVPTMSLGGHGTANVSGNMIPQEMAQISTPWSDFDDVTQFQDTYTRILPMLEFAYCAVNPVPAKSFLGAVGMPAGPMRRPLALLDPERLAVGLQAARELGLGEKYGYQLSSEYSVASTQ
jgi:4-hydroxy-tetrahydrodipicolinate synthase